MKNRENKTISENEAIERIKYHMYTAEQAVGGMRMEDLEMAIKALEEVQQYRTIGTPEECRAAVENDKETLQDEIYAELTEK